jgi:DNA mismatch endonuclease (patch repair protein)
MTDVHTKEVRSYNMSQIRGKNTKPEMLVRKYLFSKGLRYKLHDKNLPGKPDLILPKFKTVILINGCYWHGHENCKYFVPPKTNRDWWLKKINGNKIRDEKNKQELISKGWKVIVLWECELKSANRERTLETLLKNFIK